MSCVREPSPSPTSSQNGDHVKNDGKKKRFHPLRGLRKIFKRKGRTLTSSENIAPVSENTENNCNKSNNNDNEDSRIGLEYSRSQSTSQLTEDEPNVHRRSLHSNTLSLSHDSVFATDQRPEDSVSDASIYTHRLGFAHSSIRAELFEVVHRRRVKEENNSDDEDLGLPRSSTSSTPTDTDFTKDKIINNKCSQSTCSDGSLLSMESSQDEDSFSYSNSRNSSKLSLYDRRQSSGPDSSPDKKVVVKSKNNNEDNSSLSHNAAKHKMAVKPKRTHGPPRRQRQITPTVTTLPTTLEVNEEILPRVQDNHNKNTQSDSVQDMPNKEDPFLMKEEETTKPVTIIQSKCSSLPPGVSITSQIKLTRSKSNAIYNNNNNNQDKNEECDNQSFFSRLLRRSGKKKTGEHDKSEKPQIKKHERQRENSLNLIITDEEKIEEDKNVNNNKNGNRKISTSDVISECKFDLSMINHCRAPPIPAPRKSLMTTDQKEELKTIITLTDGLSTIINSTYKKEEESNVEEYDRYKEEKTNTLEKEINEPKENASNNVDDDENENSAITTTIINTDDNNNDNISNVVTQSNHTDNNTTPIITNTTKNTHNNIDNVNNRIYGRSVSNEIDNNGNNVFHRSNSTYGDSVVNKVENSGNNGFNRSNSTYGNSVVSKVENSDNNVINRYGDSVVNKVENSGNSVINRSNSTYGDSVVNKVDNNENDVINRSNRSRSISNEEVHNTTTSIYNRPNSTYDSSVAKEVVNSTIIRANSTYDDKSITDEVEKTVNNVINRTNSTYDSSVANRPNSFYSRSVSNEADNTVHNIINRSNSTYDGSVAREIDNTVNRTSSTYEISVANEIHNESDITPSAADKTIDTDPGSVANEIDTVNNTTNKPLNKVNEIIAKDSYTDNNVVLRRKSKDISQNKDDEPELMKVFARRSMKLKESDLVDIPTEMITKSQHRDSDKENEEIESPPETRKISKDDVLNTQCKVELKPITRFQRSISSGDGDSVLTVNQNEKRLSCKLSFSESKHVDTENKDTIESRNLPYKRIQQRREEWEKRAQLAMKVSHP